MSAAARVWLALAAFLVTAGAVYGFTSHELAGAPLLVVAAAVFFYLGVVARAVARRSPDDEGESEAEVHVAPTIWPFGFSIAGVVLVVGFIVGSWLVAVGIVLFCVSAAGWLREVSRAHAHADRS